MLLTLEEKTKKLGTLPWQALYDLALAMKIDEEDIKHNEKALIISKIIGISTLEDEQIESLVNDYIYGSRITFTLWSFERILNESEHAIVSGLENVTEHYLDCKGFRNLHIMNVKKYEDRFEVLYTYSKEYSYTDETGKDSSVWELHRGCVWIGIDKAYVACISKHDKMTSWIIDYLIQKIKLKIIQIKPPKSALEKCIKYRAMSRITLISPDGEKTIISKSDGFTANQEDEAARIKEGRFDTSGSYIADISEDTCATIKYNIKKGNIGIYKHLSASELFEWTSKAIDIILDEIEALKGKPAEDIFAELGIEIKWNLLSTVQNTALNWFLTQVIAVQSHKRDMQLQIPDFAAVLLHEPKLFLKIPKVYCEECESYECPICTECGEPLNYISDGSLQCTCGAPLTITCGERHKHCKQDSWFIPVEKFKMAIQKNYKNAFQGQEAKFNMCVMGNTLNIIYSTGEDNPKVEISFDSIECFKFQDGKDMQKCKEYAVYLNEKCNGTCSYKKIQDCTVSSNSVCLPKIFYGILPNYRPQPHKGAEYGDISGQIQVGSDFYELKGIIKKNTENKGYKPKTASELIGRPLLSTSTEGQEIIRQFVEQGMNDQRCQVIAIIAPQYFDSGLKGTLRYLARLSHKMITFIELDEVSKIIAMNDKIALS